MLYNFEEHLEALTATRSEPWPFPEHHCDNGIRRPLGCSICVAQSFVFISEWNWTEREHEYRRRILSSAIANVQSTSLKYGVDRLWRIVHWKITDYILLLLSGSYILALKMANTNRLESIRLKPHLKSPIRMLILLISIFLLRHRMAIFQMNIKLKRNSFIRT